MSNNFYKSVRCERCGAENSDEAVFCQKCAFRLSTEEETRISRSTATRENPDEEKEIFTVRPTMMFVNIGYGLAILGAFLVVFILDFIRKQNVAIPWWLFILSGFALLLIPAFFHIKQKLLRYTLTDSKIEISEGLISTNTRNIPLRNIQDVSVSATIFQRLLGFGNLVIENANETDGKIVLKNIRSPKKYADILLKQMRLLNR